MSEKNLPLYTISTASSLCGLSVHTLRMYEREGLLIPFKKSSGHRLFSEMDLERIKCIQSTINVEKINIEGIRRLLALIPCWKIINCSESDRAKCEAYSGYSKPCWFVNHKNNICEGKDCSKCEVYNSFSTCASIKQKLQELLK